MHILHWDKTRDFQADSILPDWREWARRNGYQHIRSVPLSVGNLSITFEVFKHHNENHTDAYLLYHPRIGETTNTETLCILPDDRVLQQMFEAEQQMAISVMKLLQ